MTIITTRAAWMNATINRDGRETMEGFETDRLGTFTAVQLLGEIVP